MKKIAYIIVVISTLVGAMNVSAQMRWGATAAVNITDIHWNQSSLRGEPFTSDTSVGYAAGIIGEYEIPGIGFGIDIGLQYSQRGATMNLGDFPVWSSDGFDNERIYIHYLDIPFHFRFKYSNLNGFERKVAPLVFVGPVMSIRLADNNLKAAGEDAFKYNNVYLGLEVGLGAEVFRNYQITASYTWDVTGSIESEKLLRLKGNNRTWKVACTYFF